MLPAAIAAASDEFCNETMSTESGSGNPKAVTIEEIIDRKGLKRAIAQMTPNTLNTVCARAALFAETFATAAAILAVIVVPMFSPSTRAAAIGKGIQPKLTMTRVRAMVAEDDCSNIVRTVPMPRKSRTDQNP